MEMLIKELSGGLKDVDVPKGIVTGYFSHFGSLDSDGDIVVKGAFAKTIQENGPQSARPRIKHLLDHDRTKGIGVLQVLQEDTTGLYYESKAGSWTLGQDFVKMCQDGLITEHSIGYRVIKGNPTDDGYQLLELMLREGSSLQCWGANENTPFRGLKSAEALLERVQLLSKAVHRGTYSDETYIKLYEEIQAISTFLESKRPATKPEESKQDEPTLPEDADTNTILKQLAQLYHGN